MMKNIIYGVVGMMALAANAMAQDAPQILELTEDGIPTEESLETIIDFQDTHAAAARGDTYLETSRQWTLFFRDSYALAKSKVNPQ